ncbi:MAG: glycosyltransferase family 39 protein [Candidatus Kerfeldbacteria bacterium]|nr:glycosyltransferase family 39 protein [Candidatus Kerfeldbacteria bacterium]
MKKGIVWLLVALIIGAGLRLYHFDRNPQGIHPDEALYGYEGLSIRDTGTDYRQTGRPPLYLKGVSTDWDNRTSVLYPYIFSVLFRFLPVTIATLRSVSMLLGLGLIVVVYVVGRELFPERPSIAAVASILTSLSPLAISWSRVGHDPITLPFLAGLTFVSMLKARHHPAWWFLAATAVAIGFYSYQPLKFVGPAMIVLGLWYTWPAVRPHKVWFFSSAILGLVTAWPFLVTQIRHWSAVQGQFQAISIWHFHPLVGWFALNLVAWPISFVFNPSIVLLLVGPLFVFGWLTLWPRDRRRLLLLLWLLAAAVPSFITLWQPGGNEVQSRSLAIIGPLEIGAAWAMVMIAERIRLARQDMATTAWLWPAITAVFLLPQILFAGWLNHRHGSFCCFLLGGMDQAIAVVQRPAYAQRPVVVDFFQYSQGINLLWNTHYPPALFQHENVGWTNQLTGQNLHAQYPSHFGRYKLCALDECYQSTDQALYVVPEGNLNDRQTVFRFRLNWYGVSYQWKVVDNALPAAS